MGKLILHIDPPSGFALCRVDKPTFKESKEGTALCLLGGAGACGDSALLEGRSLPHTKTQHSALPSHFVAAQVARGLQW